MSTEAAGVQGTEPPHGESWPTLSRNERRVLGVLIEKAKTTPDAYPLTLNALITGCNQKNNRDPLLQLQDADVNEAVATLKKHGLVQQITGSGRSDKYRHAAYDEWKVDKVQVAILGELLLRGPQTEGELRGRASRMEPIADLDQLRAQLKALTQRRMVVYLTPEGRRGTTVTHGFHAADELERLRSRADAAAPDEPAPNSASPAPPGRSSAGLEQRLEAVEREMASLRTVVAQLQAHLAAGAEANGLTEDAKMY